MNSSLLVRLRSIREQVRSSLFFVPSIYVVGGFILAQTALGVDSRVDGLSTSLEATVDSARAVLGVVASATIGFAGIAFSVSLLLISLASSQYSPRVVHGLFRDPFNKQIMGVVIGTFTYCLVILRAVRGPLEEGGAPVVPSISIVLAVVLGVITILAIVGFISHAAHSMDVSKILHDVTDEALTEIRRQWTPREDDTAETERIASLDAFDDVMTVTFDRDGWVQQIDTDALVAALPADALMQVETIAGRYAIAGTPLCRITPTPPDGDRVAKKVRSSVGIGDTRTMQDDVTYGIRQLADVALKALSPGINDPTTAQDAMFHLGTVLRELLSRTAGGARRVGDDGQVVLLKDEATATEVVALAFDEIRLAAAGQPTVQIYLLELLHLLDVSLCGTVSSETAAALRRQADLIADGADRSDLLDADRDRVLNARAKRFGRVEPAAKS